MSHLALYQYMPSPDQVPGCIDYENELWWQGIHTTIRHCQWKLRDLLGEHADLTWLLKEMADEWEKVPYFPELRGLLREFSMYARAEKDYTSDFDTRVFKNTDLEICCSFLDAYAQVLHGYLDYEEEHLETAREIVDSMINNLCEI